jgi:hypothetical protein
MLRVCEDQQVGGRLVNDNFVDNTKKLISRWLSAEQRVNHELSIVGNRLVSSDNKTVAVKFAAHDERLVVVAAILSSEFISYIPRDVLYFGINPTAASEVFAFFELENDMRRKHRASNMAREASIIGRALDIFSNHGIPLPERLVRARRFETASTSQRAKMLPLLVFHEFQVPNRFRFAMLQKDIDLSDLQPSGSYIHTSDHVVFEKEEDALLLKMRASRDAYIIDLQGVDPITVPVPEPDEVIF